MSTKPGTRPTSPNGRGQQNQKQKQAPAIKNTPQYHAAEEAKRAARVQRQQEAQAAARQRKRAVLMRQIGIAAVIVLVLAGGWVALAWKADNDAKEEAIREANKPGQLVPQQASPHIQTVDTPHEPYSTSPPTSGPHVREVPNWGVYTTAIPKEGQVHALEDAGVVINYKPGLDQATVDRLAALAKSFSTQIIMSPYDGLSNSIVLTAWRRIDKLDNFDEARIKRFIDAYRGIDHHKDSGS